MQNIFKEVDNYIQNGIFIDYTIINQIENGSYEEGGKLYTYSFYITPKGEDWIYQISVDEILEGYKECLIWLIENYNLP